jgi:hypothetical protein
LPKQPDNATADATDKTNSDFLLVNIESPF